MCVNNCHNVRKTIALNETNLLDSMMHAPGPCKLSHKRLPNTADPLGDLLEQVHVPPFMNSLLG